MIENFFKKFHNHFFWGGLVMIFLVGVFFRAWNFDSWVHVKSDQVRDAMMISHSLSEGPGSLPLLGPKAGGTKLRLGPVFYHFQYLSARVFGSSLPPVLAYPNLIFSILAIPLFFLFFLLFFSRFASLLLTAVFASSFLAVEYSRFAWNPNSTVFFSLLFFYALARIFSGEEKGKMKWVAVLAASFSISSQLHFVSLLGLSVSTFFFLLLSGKNVKKHLSWKDVLLFVSIVLVFYVPVIINDILTQGSNSQEFLRAISGKSSDGSLAKNLWKDGYYFGQYSFRILTGYLGSNKIYHYLGMLFIALGFVVSLLTAFSRKAKEKNQQAARLAVAVFLGFFVLFVPLADDIDKPRFYLSIFWLPLIFLGLIHEYFSFLGEKTRKTFLVLAVVIFSFSNVFFVSNWFSELSQSDRGKLDPKKTVVLLAKKDPLWLPWGRQEKIAGFMEENCQEKKIFLSVSKSVQDFSRPIRFAFDAKKKTGQTLATFKKNSSMQSQACYFYLARNGDALPQDFQPLAVKKPVVFGSVLAYRLDAANQPSPNQVQIPADIDPDGVWSAKEDLFEEAAAENPTENPSNEPGNIKRLYWRDVFGKQ